MQNKVNIIVLFVVYCGLIAAGLPVSGTPAADGEPALHLRLPVQPIIGNSADGLRELEKDKLALSVNGELRTVSLIERKRRQIDKSDGPGRHFVLSFHMKDFKPGIMDAVKYVVEHILEPLDTLTIVSPMRDYRIRRKRGKKHVMETIERILKEDAVEYKALRKPLIQATGKEIKNVDWIRNVNAVHRNTIALLFNFHGFCREVVPAFKRHYTAPFRRQQRLLDRLPRQVEGDIWWIHFQHRFFNDPIPARLKATVNWLDNGMRRQAYSRSPSAFRCSFKDLWEQMNSLPARVEQRLSQRILAGNVCYNVVYWGNNSIGNGVEGKTCRDDLDNVFKRLAGESGGLVVSNVNAGKAAAALQHHKNDYYEVMFRFNGKREDKNIYLTLKTRSKKDKKNQLIYPRLLGAGNIKPRTLAITRKKVKIVGFNMKGNRVGFGVTSFHRTRSDKNGLLNIQLALYNEKENEAAVFTKQKELDAYKETVYVRLKLPGGYSGAYRLRISVYDTFANRWDSIEKPVRL